MGFKEHAVRELKLAEQLDSTHVVLEFYEPIVALVEAYANSGQSGGSHPYVSRVLVDSIDALLNRRVLSPLTGKSDEWYPAREGLYQNIRDSRLFKKENTSECFLIDSVYFVDEQGDRVEDTVYTLDTDENGETTKTEINDFVVVKKFPVTPEIFCIRTNKIGNNYFALDIDLQKVAEYYS